MVKSAVIGLVGITPMGDVSTLVQYPSEKDAAIFDSQFAGFTTSQALGATYDHSTDTALAINVLDPMKHKTATEDEMVTFGKSTGQARLAHPVVANVVMGNSEGSTIHTVNADYRVDAQAGALTSLGKAIEAGGSVEMSYEYTDPSKATAADIIGGANSVGNRTGMKLLNNSPNLYGYFTKILIVPMFCAQRSIAIEFIAMVEKLGAMTYIGAPVGTTSVQALASRGPKGTINFNISSDRARLHHLHAKVHNPVTNTKRLEPLSQHAVGLCAKVGLDKGCWRSSSSQEILGITGVERQLLAMIDDPQSEVNLFNEQGITTVFSSYGSGPRLQGNRAATWPTVIHMRDFGDVHRTGDVTNESIRCFNQQYIDMPTTQALIGALMESVNTYGCKTIGDDVVLGSRYRSGLTRSPKAELVAGHLLLNYEYTPPPPLGQLTFETEITSEYLLTLRGDN